MKKLISLLVIICILCPLLVGCGIQDAETRMKKRYLRKFKIDGKTPEDVVIDYDGGTYNGARIVMLDAECNDPKEWNELVAGYEFNYYDSNRLYAYKYGHFFTLEKAYQYSILEESDVREIVKKYSDEVTEYIDICDKYDFDMGAEIEFGTYHIDISNRIICNERVWLNIDAKMFSKNSDGNINAQKVTEHINSYLGTKIIAGVRIRFGYDYHYKCWVGEFFMKDVVTMDNLYQIMQELSCVPGIKKVACHCLYISLEVQAANDNYYSPNQWGLEYINVEKVWDFTTGSLNTTVGVIDSGINEHDELIVNYNLLSGYDFCNDVPIYPNFELGMEYQVDQTSHGTGVAGVIGALGNNNTGISGVNWYASLVPYKINDTYYTSEEALQNSAILLAQAIAQTTYDCRGIINISMHNMINYPSVRNQILSYSGLVVYASGNENKNIDEDSTYFGFYGEDDEILDNVIVVGALNENGNRWYEEIYGEIQASNYGDEIVEIYAPGDNIYTTSATGGYEYKTGTSFAAPHVSGVAALLLSIQPNLTGAQLKECIIGGADEIVIDICTPENPTVKKLNAWGAFKYLMDNYYTFELDAKNIGISSNQLDFDDKIENTSPSSTFKENTSFIELNIEREGHYRFIVSSNNDIKSGLYNTSYELIIERSTYSEALASAEFLVYLESGTYYLKTNFIEEIIGDGELSFNIVFTEATHYIAERIRYTSTHHQCICGCGYDMGTEPHAVKLSEVVLGIGHCIYCGARVMLGDDIVQVPGMLNIQKVSINGSYILPSGIIVIVDEDIEAYENGTLVFYDKDDLPQTE